jgi:quercetin dioxygenase-like cupin family protein
MAKLFTKDQLPHFNSTRDTRDRLDLVTENVPLGATRLRADRIIYHPGDTCAKHYHLGCHHVFVILEGEGLLFGPEDSRIRLKPGMIAIVARKSCTGLKTISRPTSSLSSSGRPHRLKRSGLLKTIPEPGPELAEFQSLST